MTTLPRPHRLLPCLVLMMAGTGANVAADEVAPSGMSLPKPVMQKLFNQNSEHISMATYRFDPLSTQIRSLTVAERRFLFHRLGKRANQPLDIVITCFITPAGIVTTNCTPPDLDEGKPGYLLWNELGKLPRPEFPAFPVVKPSRTELRRVEYILHLDAVRPSEPAWLNGPLVNREEIGAPLRGSPIDYPSDIIMRRKEGRVTFECQVQGDLSVTCRTTSVEPEKNARYFEDLGADTLLVGLAKPKLADGRSSIGARVRFTVDFKLPTDY